MATISTRRRITAAGLVTGGCLLAFFALVAWFLGPNIVEARQEKLLAYVLHIGGGSVVLLTGPFQFIAPIRNRYRRYHRIAGYTFLAGTAAAVVGFLLLLPTETDLFLLSQIVALTLWVMSAAVAVIAIRRKHVLTHQHNMARSFVIAAYFVWARVVDQHLMWALVPFASNEGARFAHSDWLAWFLPLIVVEIWFGRKWDRLLNRRHGASS